MTRQQRARRYLQASAKAGYTSLPAEHREAYQAQMREHERAYPRVREHALAGADQDFDEPLAPGEREHQQHLRTQEGLQYVDVLRIRKDLRGTTTSSSRRAPARPRRSRAALTTPQAAAQAAVDPLKAAISGKGSLWLQIAGYTLGLSLVYLLVSGKHIPEALKGISNVVIGAAKTFIAPVDPITAFEGALHATPAAPSVQETGTVAGEAIAAGATPAGAKAQELGIEATGSTGTFRDPAVKAAARAFDQAHGIKLPAPLQRPQNIAGALRAAHAASIGGEIGHSILHAAAEGGV